MDPEGTRRRIRAARALADLTVEQLAERISDTGLGSKTLGKIERGERAVRTMELRVIAEACGLPYEFFTADLAAMSDSASGPWDTHVLDELRALLEQGIEVLLAHDRFTRERANAVVEMRTATAARVETSVLDAVASNSERLERIEGTLKTLSIEALERAMTEISQRNQAPGDSSEEGQVGRGGLAR